MDTFRTKFEAYLKECGHWAYVFPLLNNFDSRQEQIRKQEHKARLKKLMEKDG